MLYISNVLCINASRYVDTKVVILEMIVNIIVYLKSKAILNALVLVLTQDSMFQSLQP